MTEYTYENPRTNWAITLSVWKALFLREAITRLSSGRGAWGWLLLEPIIHASIPLLMFTVMRMRDIGGIDTVAWLLTGLTSYFMFKRAGGQAKNAIAANRSLFSYRQVKPVDTVIVRAVLEGYISIINTAILAAGALLFAVDVVPDDPLLVITAYFGLWLMGLGYGLVTSVAVILIPELDRIINFIMMPLYMLSGVIFPIASIPMPYRQWLLYNPLAHGVDAARVGVSSFYHGMSEVDLLYLYEVAVISIFLGLALHRRFAVKLLTL